MALGCLLAANCLANGTLDRPEDAMDLAVAILPALDAHEKPLMWVATGIPRPHQWLLMGIQRRQYSYPKARSIASSGRTARWTAQKSLDALKKRLMWPWDACWLRMSGERHAGPPRRRDGSGLRVAILPALDAHEKPLMWPWDACCH